MAASCSQSKTSRGFEARFENVVGQCKGEALPLAGAGSSGMQETLSTAARSKGCRRRATMIFGSGSGVHHAVRVLEQCVTREQVPCPWELTMRTGQSSGSRERGELRSARVNAWKLWRPLKVPKSIRDLLLNQGGDQLGGDFETERKWDDHPSEIKFDSVSLGNPWRMEEAGSCVFQCTPGPAKVPPSPPPSPFWA